MKGMINMKKVLSVVLAVIITAALAVAASAGSYNPKLNCQVEIDIYKANPADVIKDGVIGENEYAKAPIDNDPASTSLDICFGNEPSTYLLSEAMCRTTEFYFSWDDTHGFNMAVRYKPDTIQQTLSPKTGDMPCDEFLCNAGVHLTFDTEKHNSICKGYEYGMIYRFAVAKRTDTGEYMEGWYEARGLSGNYKPTAEQDYIITYGDDGYITCEWSVPFSEIYPDAAAGTPVYFSIALCAGTDTESQLYTNCYSVTLGDYGFLCLRNDSSNHAVGYLSDQLIAGNDETGSDTGSDTGTSAGPSESGTARSDTTVNTPDEVTTYPAGNTDTPAGNGNTAGNTTPAAQTADPFIAVAALCAFSAGAVIILRKKH